MISANKKKMYEQDPDYAGPNSRDMGIIKNSLLGTFNNTFDIDEFRTEARKLKRMFEGSDILSGIQPWILYFNMPEALVSHRLRP